MDKYQFVKKLGEGAYGIVIKCVNKQTQEIVAIKKMKGQYADWDKCLQMPEVQSLKKLNNSPYIVRIKEMVHNKKEEEVNIVFEYCDKNLFQELQERQRKNQQFTEKEIKIIMFQAISAIQYIHQNGYMHRDVKPENFLLNNTTIDGEELLQIKLADFGLAKDFRKNRNAHNTEYVSTRWYRAPELVLRSPNYNESVDIFALGAIMAELFMGRPLFPGTSESDQLTRILTVLGTPSEQEWPEGYRLSKQKNIRFQNVIPTSLKQHLSTSYRMDISDTAIDLMEKMFKYNNDQRISAQQCLQHEFFSNIPNGLKNMGNQMSMSQINMRRVQRTRLQQQQSSAQASNMNQDLAPGLGVNNSQGLSGRNGPVAPVMTSNNLGNSQQNSSQLIIQSGQQNVYGTIDRAGSGINKIPMNTNESTNSPNFQLNSKFQMGAVAQVQGSSGVAMAKRSSQIHLDGQGEMKKSEDRNKQFNPRMSKYGHGQFLSKQVNNTVPINNSGAVAINNNKDEENPFKPKQYSSKMENYENNTNNGRSQLHMKDDFFDKMINDSNNLYGGNYQQSNNNQKFGYGTFYKKQQNMQQQPNGTHDNNFNGYGGQIKMTSDQIQQSQSLGMLPLPRSGSRLDQMNSGTNDQNNRNVMNMNAAVNQNGMNSNSPRQIGAGSLNFGTTRGGLGTIGGNIISSSGMNQNLKDYVGQGGAVTGANGKDSLQTIPVLKPSSITPAPGGALNLQSKNSYNPNPGNKQFSSLGQALITSNSPERNQNPKKGDYQQVDNSYGQQNNNNFLSHRNIQGSQSKLPSSHGRPHESGKSFGGAAIGILRNSSIHNNSNSNNNDFSRGGI